MNSKVNLIVWSYNRAAQLDLLLRSVEKFALGEFNTFILYKADGRHEDGYKLCQQYNIHTTFVKEKNFNSQSKELIGLGEYTCVSTDDSVLTGYFKFHDHLVDGVNCLSLRLGLNTVTQCPFQNISQPSLSRYVDEGDTIVWDSRHYHPLTNYGFKMGHDFVIYTKKYRELIESCPFRKTNELESWLFDNCQDKINPYIRSFKQSKAVNIPSNNHSLCTQADNSLPFEEVNNKFLDGYRFRLKEVEDTKIVGCHQLISLVMERE